MPARDELIARLHERLGDIDSWLKSYEQGLITDHRQQEVWKDASPMDKEAFEQLKRDIHDSIKHLEEYGQ